VPCSAAGHFPPYSDDGEQVFTLRRGEGFGVSFGGGGGREHRSGTLHHHLHSTTAPQTHSPSSGVTEEKRGGRRGRDYVAMLTIGVRWYHFISDNWNTNLLEYRFEVKYYDNKKY